MRGPPSAAAPRPAAAPAGPARAPGAAALAPATAEVIAWVLAPPPRLTYPAVVQLLDAARLQGFAALHGGALSGAPLVSLADVGMLGLPGNGVCELGELPGDGHPGASRQLGAFALLSRARVPAPRSFTSTRRAAVHVWCRLHLMSSNIVLGLPSLDLTGHSVNRTRQAQHMCVRCRRAGGLPCAPSARAERWRSGVWRAGPARRRAQRLLVLGGLRRGRLRGLRAWLRARARRRGRRGQCIGALPAHAAGSAPAGAAGRGHGRQGAHIRSGRCTGAARAWLIWHCIAMMSQCDEAAAANAA